MKAIKIRDPMRQLGRLDAFLDFENAFRALGVSRHGGQEGVSTLRLDLSEDNAAYHASIDLPGARKSEIQVSIAGKQVTVSVEVDRKKDQAEGKDLYVERFTGSACRTFSVPTNIDAESSQANYEHGVLKLILPKAASSDAKQLSVN